MLSLFNTGIAWGMAEVESRSQASSRSNLGGGADEQNVSLDSLKKMEFLQREIQELRGKVEEQSYQLQQAQEQQKKLYLDLDRRLREGGTAKASGPTASSGISFEENIPQDTKLQGGIEAENIVVDDEKAYQAAYRLIQNKDYDAALAAFKAMIQNAPQGKYAPNAHYWLGEIYLVKGSLDQASESFNIVFRQYPQHPKAADSLLKLGYVEYSKGQWKRSGELLKQVKTQFPGTTSAQLADSRLQKMQHEGHI